MEVRRPFNFLKFFIDTRGFREVVENARNFVTNKDVFRKLKLKMKIIKTALFAWSKENLGDSFHNCPLGCIVLE